MRPGGLTALAVFNFVFGGLGGIASLIGLATVGMQLDVLRKAGGPVPSEGLMYGLLLLGLVRAALLITSGIGYLGRKRTIGRLFGNLYAVLAFASIILEATQLATTFTIFNLVDFVYPLITLFLLNVIFRKDFT